jgi:hypothetical protein
MEGVYTNYGSMSSIKRDVKKKAPPRPEPRFFLEIQPTLFRFSEDVWLVVHSRKVPVNGGHAIEFERRGKRD